LSITTLANLVVTKEHTAAAAIGQATLPCDYAVPGNPAGGTIDPATAIVRFTTGGVPRDFGQVKDATVCAPEKFFIEGDRIKLCPAACNLVQADPEASVKVLFGCLPKDVQ
jgi:hypothetical protein